MGATTGITWAHSTFNPWRGCARVSPGCVHCYAETMAGRNPAILGRWGVKGTRVVAAESMWREVGKWNHEAMSAGERRRVFCASLADVFEAWDGVPQNAKGEPGWVYERDGSWAFARKAPAGFRPMTLDDVRARLWNLIRSTPWLDWLLLTKRGENLPSLLPWEQDHSEPWPNAWIGVSTENQEYTRKRVLELMAVRAAVRWLSAEPLLGPIDPFGVVPCSMCGARADDPADRCGLCYGRRPPFDWCIVGGESGPGARPMDLAWARKLRDQCAKAKVAYFFKQLGNTQAREIGAKRKGDTFEQFPDDLKVHEFPVAVESGLDGFAAG